jgi:cytochrome c
MNESHFEAERFFQTGKVMSLHNCVHLWRIICLAAFFVASVSYAHAEDDAAKGAIIFRQCKLCHSAEKGTNKEGPSLYGVIGRPAGSVAGYSYSDAMKAAAVKGLIWSADNVEKYLVNPHQFLADYLGDPDAHNRMTFKLGGDQDREDVIAYLQSLQVK